MIGEMVGQIGVVKENVGDSSVSELVTSLKSAFHNAYFTQVEEALVSREEKLKREIEGKNREIEKLQRFQKECGELKELTSNLREERDELKRKNCDLACAKLNAETELDLLKGRFKVLDERVSSLEKDNEMLDRLEKNGGGVDVEMEMEKDAFANQPLDTNAGKTKANEKTERLNLVEDTEKFDADDRIHSETNPDPNPSGGSSYRKKTDNRRPLSKDIIEIIDSDDESASPERGTVTEEHLQKADSGQNVACNEAVHKRTSASSVVVNDDCSTERGKQGSGKNVAKNEPAVLERTPASFMDVEDRHLAERARQDRRKNVAESEPSVLKRTSASSVDVDGSCPTERDGRDSGKNVAYSDPAVRKRTSTSSVDVDGSCPTESGKRDLGENVAENETAVLENTSASSVTVDDSRPTERGKQDSKKNVAETEPAVFKGTSASSVDVIDARSTEDSEKNAAENEPAVVKRTSASSVDVEDSCPTKRGKRLKVEEHAPFASPVKHCSPATLNLETLYAGKVDPSSNLSKILSELGDDSSSSSSSDDDEVDLSLDYSTIFKPLD